MKFQHVVLAQVFGIVELHCIVIHIDSSILIVGNRERERKTRRQNINAQWGPRRGRGGRQGRAVSQLPPSLSCCAGRTLTGWSASLWLKDKGFSFPIIWFLKASQLLHLVLNWKIAATLEQKLSVWACLGAGASASAGRAEVICSIFHFRLPHLETPASCMNCNQIHLSMYDLSLSRNHSQACFYRYHLRWLGGPAIVILK